MHKWQANDLRWVLSGALLLMALVAVSEGMSLPPAIALGLKVLRIPLALAYILYVPGYWLTAIFFPEAPAHDSGQGIDGIERTALSLGLSAAWMAVLALVLDRLPWGLRLWPILLGEVISVLVFMTLALWRRQRLPAGAVYQPELPDVRRTWRALPAIEQRIFAFAFGLILLAGLAAGWALLRPAPGQFMTEFYLLGEEGLAEGYPYDPRAGEEVSATIGIHNLERETMTYRVEVWAVDSWEERREQVQAAGPFTLAREETVEERITWAMPWAGQDQMVDFYLVTDAGGDELYRQLRLWLDVRD